MIRVGCASESAIAVPSAGNPVWRGLEVITHGIALDIIARAEQEGAGGVVQSFLLDQRGQLGVANVGGLSQVAM